MQIKVFKCMSNLTFRVLMALLFLFQAEFNNLRRYLPNLEEFSSLLESSKLTQACQRDFQEYLRSLVNFELPALQSKFKHQAKNIGC